MDWKLFFATFMTIFIAEMGDKTQFAAMAAAAGRQSTITVLLAVILALALAGTLGVVAGTVLGQFLNPAYVKYVSGGLFIVVGLWVLLS